MMRFGSTVLVILAPALVTAFTTAPTRFSHQSTHQQPQHFRATRTSLSAAADDNKSHVYIQKVSQVALASTIFFLSSFGIAATGAFADEYGVETEAPTLFTGESVMICTKRGPLGACLKTELRTAENDNDKAETYFQAPSPLVQKKEAQMRASVSDDASEASELIKKLKQQTEDNKERNEMLVKQKTAQNDQSASFGPFDRQVVILNQDGQSFSLLENPQAMRLKKAGFIKDRKFVKQPTQEELDEALQGDEDGGFLGGIVKGIFGGDQEEE